LSSYLIDGKAVSKATLAKVGAEAAALISRGLTPGLAVVLVGSDAASQVYVGAKGKAAKDCGFHSLQFDLPETTGQAELLALVRRLNADPQVHGILVQLPLPRQVDSTTILETIAPEKDVDGFHPINVGLAAIGAFDRALIPCTPAGSMILIDHACEALGRKLDGAEAVIIGRSNIVGKPMAQLLLRESATVTVAHSKTRDLAGECRRAEILVVAAGRPEMVRGDWIMPGAVVIDVGINRVAGLQPGTTRLVGDVAFAEASQVAGAITPVPGGVGPMTIAMLLSNTVTACCRQNGLPDD